MDFANAFIDKYNLIMGAIVALLSYFLGKHWIIFAAFLAFNVIDWITGWMKSRIAGAENSMKGLKGILKKLGYWIMIAVAFGTSAVFMEIGKTIGIDLKVTTYLGWLVLAMLIVNEIRSILENLVEAGIKVPSFLIKGLQVAEKMINDSVGSIDGSLIVDKSDEAKDVYRLDLNVPPEDLEEKDSITLKVEKNT